MVIIAGKVYVATDQRDAYVTGFQEFIKNERNEPGCLDVVVAADPIEDNRVNLFELWDSQEHMDAFRRIAKSPALTTEILEDHTMKYEISASGPSWP